MEQVLYAKYNSLRKPEYRITTEIREDDQHRFAVKRAAEPAARGHLKQIAENARRLSDYYRQIEIVRAEEKEGVLIFPYIRGRTLLDRIPIDHFNRQEFIAQLKEIFTLLFDLKEEHLVPFSISEGFRDYFGEVDPGNVPAVCPANLDIILENFIENDSGIYCIDYEWVCPFAVPIDFLKYRVIQFLYSNHLYPVIGRETSLEDVLSWFDYTEDSIRTYLEMEQRLQQHIHGDGWRYRYTERYKQRVCETRDLDQLVRKLEGMVQDQEKMIAQLQNDYQEISNAFFWRMSYPLRKTIISARKLFQAGQKEKNG